ncbi:MAG: hypothetical protein HRT37_24255 [Alteromonadaceae bacterium]|nr:hypothetical protein [Alteromonadaceae bacterium]
MNKEIDPNKIPELDRNFFCNTEQTIINLKIANSQEQIKNGQYTEFNETFVEDFLTKAKIRHEIKE